MVSIERQIHLFKAAPGKASIFSPADATTKYRRAARMFAKPALWSIVGLVVSLALLFGVIQPWLKALQNTTLGMIVEITTVIIVGVITTMSIFTTLPWIAYRMRLTGLRVPMSRLVFGVVFAICGGLLGYLLAMMLAS